ncbi:hypothetical protein D9Q98_002030 [Chlorella vulgaris]|uniref:Uncharacterized protein n=1 Tax=Chlorella vulgaris TaxID=3077 RepID=A0A9D4TVR6_CHLVU|nr:hypothetical protein D9Q98_002030 [Chlorella vulgaris]
MSFIGSPTIKDAPGPSRHFLIMPFAKEIVPVVDVAGGRMEVQPSRGPAGAGNAFECAAAAQGKPGAARAAANAPQGQSAAKSGAKTLDSDGGSSSSNGSSAQSD